MVLIFVTQTADYSPTAWLLWLLTRLALPFASQKPMWNEV
jgi:hypothetical protein